ncbi:MAG: sigma-70 family RNA polymerase sigma factor [bacterium]|nr:sigma-70 family RNA polymerase sigma factor [bacterium]
MSSFDPTDPAEDDTTWLEHLARGLVANPHDAQDLVQATWLVAYSAEKLVVGPRRAWLLATMRRLAARATRSRLRRSDREARVARAGTTPSVAELTAIAEQQELLLHCVRELPEHYRGPILLRYYREMKPAAIAAELDLPIRTVHTRLQRALHLLRERLDAHHPEGRHGWIAGLASMLRVRETRRVRPGAPAVAAAAIAICSIVALSATALLRGGRSADGALSRIARAEPRRLEAPGTHAPALSEATAEKAPFETVLAVEPRTVPASPSSPLATSCPHPTSRITSMWGRWARPGGGRCRRGRFRWGADGTSGRHLSARHIGSEGAGGEVTLRAAVATARFHAHPNADVHEENDLAHARLCRAVRTRLHHRHTGSVTGMPLNGGYRYRSRVRPSEAGASVLAHHAARYTHSSTEVWRTRIEAGRVRVNGSVADCDQLLAAGDELEFERVPWVEPDVPREFGVVYEDEDVLVLEKPAGLQVLPAGVFLDNTLLNLVRSSARSRAQSSPVHRLGRGTSGLVLFGKTESALASLAAQFRDFRVTKTYLARVTGTDLPLACTARHPIGSRHHGPMRVFCVQPEGKRSVTRLRVLARDEVAGQSLVAAQPITGRPDQIRIHLAACGAPLVGDPLFGIGGVPNSDARPGEGGYFLHAVALSLLHPTTAKRLKLRSRPDWV